MSVEIFLLGASPDAWTEVSGVLAALPREVSIPIVLVLPQRHPGDELPAQLARECALPLDEPDDKDELAPGRIYLAPPGYHLLIDSGSVVLSKEPPIDLQRPSFVPLFETAADSYGETAAGMILTGVPGRHWESLRPLQSRGSSVGVGWVSEVEPESIEDIPLIPRAAVNPWVLEMCTSLSLRVGNGTARKQSG